MLSHPGPVMLPEPIIPGRAPIMGTLPSWLVSAPGPGSWPLVGVIVTLLPGRRVANRECPARQPAGARRPGFAGRGFEPVDLGLQPPGLFLKFQHLGDTGEVQPIGGQGHDLVQPADVIGAVAAGPPGLRAGSSSPSSS
jgi:hypothetical protein